MLFTNNPTRQANRKIVDQWQLTNGSLNAFLRIKINGLLLHTFSKKLVKKCVNHWYNTKERRPGTASVKRTKNGNQRYQSHHTLIFQPFCRPLLCWYFNCFCCHIHINELCEFPNCYLFIFTPRKPLQFPKFQINLKSKNPTLPGL